MLYSAVKIIWSVLSVSIIFLVLLHSPKGDGVAGIGGQAQMFSSTRTAEASLNRLTWGLTIFFLALSIILSAGWISPEKAAVNQVIPITTPADTQKQKLPLNLPAPSDLEPSDRQDSLPLSSPRTAPTNPQSNP
jgi:preprotein translocase subunit SecG